MDRMSVYLLATAIVVGLAAHGGLQLLASREEARRPPPEAAVAVPSGPEEGEARVKHWQAQASLREQETQDAAAQRQWERAYWNKVFDEASFLLRNKPQAGKYQIVRVEGQDVFVLDTATGEVTRKALPR
jgi:hypothetical protein